MKRIFSSLAVLSTALLLVLLPACSSGSTIPPSPLRVGWRLIPSPNPGSVLNSLHGVAVISTSDAWAVGYSSSAPTGTLLGNQTNTLLGKQTQEMLGTRTLIEHWNSKQWIISPSPNPGTVYNALKAITAVSVNDAWAVGYFSNSSSSDGIGLQTLIEHWNGRQWSAVPSPSPGSVVNILNGVAAISATDVWAVGYSSQRTTTVTVSGTKFNMALEEPLIEHWDGSRWSIVPSPQNPTAVQNNLNGITAISLDDIWAVGGSLSLNGQGYIPQVQQPLIEHWNGKQWSIVQSESTGASLSSLAAAAGVSSNDIWAVGSSSIFGGQGGYGSQTTQTLIEHWNGKQWGMIQNTPNSASDNNFLAWVVAISADDIWTVGASPRTYPEQGQALIEHWNGKQWSIIAGPSPGPYNNFLMAVARNPNSRELWAVGSFGEGYTPERTIAEVWS